MQLSQEQRNSIIGRVAHKVASRLSRWWAYEELVQESWVWGLQAAENYLKRDDLEHSLDGFEGWVYKCTYVHVAMFTRRARPPVTVPKKRVLPKEQHPSRGLSADRMEKAHGTMTTEDWRSVVARLEVLRTVRGFLDEACQRWPLARATIGSGFQVPDAARKLNPSDYRVLADPDLARKHARNARNMVSDRCQTTFTHEALKAVW